MAASIWPVIHDSILDGPAQGTESQNALHLVAAERNVAFKRIGAGGNALGATDASGFNQDSITDTLDRIGGYFSAYKGVVIQAATNDFGRSIPWEDTVTSLRRILAHCRANGKRALVMDAIYRDNENVPNDLGHRLGMYRFMIAVVCKTEYPDISYFASRSGTVFDKVGNYYDSKEIALGNRLHLNPTGHRNWANWLKASAAAAGYF